MQISNVTERFLKCLDQLVSEGKVRSKRHFALTLGYHAQGLSEMTASRRDVPLELIEKAVHNFSWLYEVSAISATCLAALARLNFFSSSASIFI